MKHLDALTALVMVAQADASDLIRVSLGRPKRNRARKYCLRHLEEVQHRRKQRAAKYCKVESPDAFGRIIARDDMVDLVKRGAWCVYAITRSTDQNWGDCPHCRGEQRERV